MPMEIHGWHANTLRVFHRCCIGELLGLTYWQDHITNELRNYEKNRNAGFVRNTDSSIVD